METMKKTTWLLWASAIVTILVTIYLYLHFSPSEKGDKKTSNTIERYSNGIEVKFLDKTQLNVITLLINNSKPAPQSTDSLQSDKKDSAIKQKDSDLKTRQLITDFLNESFDLRNKNENKVIQRVMTTDFENLQAILPTYPIYVNSFFWLTSPGILLEVVFWSLFGLMASLLFGVTSAAVFDPKLVPEHIGKFFYTPFLVIIIYLSLNALTNEGSIVLEGEGKGTIVLAFVLGFYTRRAIILLGKIKDIILPAKDREPLTTQAPSEKDEYKELSVPDQKSIVTNFLDNQSADLLLKYPSIELVVAALKPATTQDKAYYFIQISTKLNSAEENIPTSFEYTDANGKVYKIPAEVIKSI